MYHWFQRTSCAVSNIRVRTLWIERQDSPSIALRICWWWEWLGNGSGLGPCERRLNCQQVWGLSIVLVMLIIITCDYYYLVGVVTWLMSTATLLSSSLLHFLFTLSFSYTMWFLFWVIKPLFDIHQIIWNCHWVNLIMLTFICVNQFSTRQITVLF